MRKKVYIDLASQNRTTNSNAKLKTKLNKIKMSKIKTYKLLDTCINKNQIILITAYKSSKK